MRPEMPSLRNDLGATNRVVARACPVVGDDVGAIERAIERTPAGVGGVEASVALSSGTTSWPSGVSISLSTLCGGDGDVA